MTQSTIEVRAGQPTTDPEPCCCGTACPCRSAGPHVTVYPPASRSVRRIQAAQSRTADVLTLAEQTIRQVAQQIDDDRVGVLDAPFGPGDLEPFEGDGAADWPETEDTDGYTWELGPDADFDLGPDFDPEILDATLFNSLTDSGLADESPTGYDAIDDAWSSGFQAGYLMLPVRAPDGLPDAETVAWFAGNAKGWSKAVSREMDRWEAEDEVNEILADRWASQGREAGDLMEAGIASGHGFGDGFEQEIGGGR